MRWRPPVGVRATNVSGNTRPSASSPSFVSSPCLSPLLSMSTTKSASSAPNREVEIPMLKSCSQPNTGSVHQRRIWSASREAFVGKSSMRGGALTPASIGKTWKPSAAKARARFSLLVIVPTGLTDRYLLQPLPVGRAIVVTPPHAERHRRLAVVAKPTRDRARWFARGEGFGAQFFFALACFVDYVRHFIFYTSCLSSTRLQPAAPEPTRELLKE